MASSNKKSKRNLSESVSENEAADFNRFIVIESLEEVCLVNFSPFLIEEIISTRASPKTAKKTRNSNLLVKVDKRRQLENIKNKKMFYTTICRAYPHEKLNISKGVIRSRDLALATEDEIASALGKQGVTNIKKSPSEKVNNESRPTLTSRHLISPELQKKRKSAIVLRDFSSTSKHPWGASNINAVKRTRAMQRKIAWKKFDVQTANKIFRLTQELALFTKKKNKFMRLNTRGMFPSWKLGEL